MNEADRFKIQSLLADGFTFKAIARAVGKDPTTISKEVKKHTVVKSQSQVQHYDNLGNPIIKFCPLLSKAPFVCNGCPKKNFKCGFTKQFYYANKAHQEYRQLLTDAREGTPLNQESFYEIDKALTKGIHNGQHLYHIIQSQKLSISKSSVYRHVEKGYYSFQAIDLPRKVKFKRRLARKEPSIPKAAKINRSYADFIHFLDQRQIDAWWELDTVIGRIGGKVLVTLNYTRYNFMFAMLINEKSALEVEQAFFKLKLKFNHAGLQFSDYFPVILTDNGGEFAYTDKLMRDIHEGSYSELFFCDPNRADQKARIEKNHTLLRGILPKGSSFDELTQADVDIIFSHINNVKRKLYHGKSAFELFEFHFGKEVPSILNIQKIPAEEVIQNHKLVQFIQQFKNH